jgi:hypothetical protein
VYWVLPVLPTVPVNVQVTLPVFVSELLSRRTGAVQSVVLGFVSRFTKVTVAFRMSPGYGSQARSPVTAVMSWIVAMSVMGADVEESGIPMKMFPAYCTRASSGVIVKGVVATPTTKSVVSTTENVAATVYFAAGAISITAFDNVPV